MQVAMQNKCVMLFLQLCRTTHFPFLNSNHPKREGRCSFVVVPLWPFSSSKLDFMQHKRWNVAPCAYLSLHVYLNFRCLLQDWGQRHRARSCTVQMGYTCSFIREDLERGIQSQWKTSPPAHAGGSSWRYVRMSSNSEWHLYLCWLSLWCSLLDKTLPLILKALCRQILSLVRNLWSVT